MGENYHRRRVLQGLSAASVGALAGCTSSWFDPEPAPVDPAPAGDYYDEATVSGVVTDLDGSGLADVAVSAFRTDETLDTIVTDESGRFELTIDGPVWIRAEADGYLPQLEAARPRRSYRLALTPSAGTISLSFGGDVMFGRRFYRSNDDALSYRFRIDPSSRSADHRRILDPVAPIFETADVSSVNLETPLTTSEWRHPEKLYSFVSHPVAAEALADAGLSYAALGNNHVFDALTPGLEDTIGALDDAGIHHSGAGFDRDAAWEPAIVTRDGIDVAFLSCTTITGEQYDLDWSADREPDRSHTVERAGDSITVSGGAGVAEPTDDRLAGAVERATERADVVVVQIHGGDEYAREPTPRLERLTDAAASAGADLVVNHHPHVAGGIERRNGALVAWTLGNLIFDQNIWATLQSYTLTAHVTREGVLRASITPILLEGYVPKGVTGRLATSVARSTAATSVTRSSGDTSEASLLPSPTGLVDTTAVTPELSRREVSLSGDATIFAGSTSWIESLSVEDGSVALGRERFPTGQFGDPIVDEDRFEGPLWRFGRHGDSSGPGLGREYASGLRLARHSGNVDNALLSPWLRLPVSNERLTLSTVYRTTDDEGLELAVSWYDDTGGSSFTQDRWAIDGTDGEWARLTLDLVRPDDAQYVDCFWILSPPEVHEREVRFDELRLVEWRDEPAPAFDADHLRVDGEALVEFAGHAHREDALGWVELWAERRASPSERL
ncbi:CapA family protein [Halovivax limisalsi]|uniref:CapA family protein n=1 Tax=Halovivax limisalsi TaxID=1453760 RepID=UPI001FFC5C2D|nr:CapA family protein [Halovivax limisalsi]